MPLVIDASVMFAASTSGEGFKPLGREELIGPPLLWPETRSALHVARWRGLLSNEAAERGLSNLDSGTVRERKHRRLGRKAWEIADEFGWSKTYDAEYLALASLVRGSVVTLDRRLAKAAQRIDLPIFSL